MNVSKILAFRYIKRQKRRTIITILGIILAVALFTAISVMLDSIEYSQAKQNINVTGSYDVLYDGLDMNNINYLKSNYSVSQVGISIYVGNGFLKQDQISKYTLGDRTIRAYEISFYEDNVIKMRNVKLQEGKFPRNENEAVAPKMLMKQGYKLNDKIKLYISVNDSKNVAQKEFTISGFSKETNNMFFISQKAADNIMAGKSKYSAYVNLKNKADFKKSFKTIEAKIKPKFKNYNDGVLLLKGKSINNYNDIGNLIVMIILGGIILISSALVIYSAFNMSIFQRIKEFGVLRALGASSYHVKSIVFIEAFIMIGIGIPLGILCGIGVIKIIFLIVNVSKFSIFDSAGMAGVYISLKTISICAGFGILCIIFSSVVPVYKSSKITPMEAIRGYSKGSGIAKYKKRYNPIKKKFRFETFLTFRNMKRNKKSFRLVVSSIAVSIVIFVSFYAFLYRMLQYFNYGGFIKDLHIYSNDISFKKEDVYGIKKISGVKNIYPLEESSFMILCPKSNISPEFKSVNKRALSYYGGYFYDVNDVLTGYDLNEINLLKNVVIDGKIDTEKLNSGEEVLIFDGIDYEANGKTIRETNLKPGDEIYIDNNKIYDRGNVKKVNFEKLRKVKVGAVLSREISYYKNLNGISAITSAEGYKNITGLEGFSEFQVELDKNADRKKVKTEIGDKLGVNYRYKIDDSVEIEEQAKQYKIEIYALVYGFIGVISLIGVLNIINTVNTNLMLRLKEFACLRAAGMSMGSLKKTLLSEGLLYGVYGIFYGTIFSSILYYLICKSINNISGLNWILFCKEIVVSSIGVFAVIFLSMMFPIKKIEKINIVEIMGVEE
ncbi:MULTISPECIES: ABC transporter permease [Clostridium]|uniref:ABC transporter permease n=1 Tax=Clostridium TaxID=1485 RepID=UPI000826C3B4|nr:MULTISPECIES: ABC transporter permease [Clostridium]PJI07897.1 ABC transporter permease [Clostridium sp. CT7]